MVVVNDIAGSAAEAVVRDIASAGSKAVASTEEIGGRERSSDCSRCELVFNVVMCPSGPSQQPVKVRIDGFRLNLFLHQVERIG